MSPLLLVCSVEMVSAGAPGIRVEYNGIKREVAEDSFDNILTEHCPSGRGMPSDKTLARLGAEGLVVRVPICYSQTIGVYMMTLGINFLYLHSSSESVEN